MPLTFKFGEMEAILADLNDIPSAQRTAFQARLKNFHRLGFPKGIGSGRGRAAVYGVGELVQMGLAVELTQLGLTPERGISVLQADEFPMLMAVMMAANACADAPEDSFQYDIGPADRHPLSIFLYFDPSVLSPRADGIDEDLASATFFYGGEGIVRENLALWTTGASRRISLINVTAMIWWMSGHLADEQQKDFFKEVAEWADGVIRRRDFDLDEWLLGPVRRAMVDQAANHNPNNYEGRECYTAKLPQLIEDAKIDVSVAAALVEFPEQRAGEPKPDMILNLPGQRTLFVDAKTLPMADYPHEAIADRVEELAQRPYSTPFTDVTKYTVLYVEYDDFYTKAAQADKRLWDWALEKNVVITSPTTMLILLREAQAAWAEVERLKGDVPVYSRGSAADQAELNDMLAKIQASDLPESAKMAAERLVYERTRKDLEGKEGTADGDR